VTYYPAPNPHAGRKVYGYTEGAWIVCFDNLKEPVRAYGVFGTYATKGAAQAAITRFVHAQMRRAEAVANLISAGVI